MTLIGLHAFSRARLLFISFLRRVFPSSSLVFPRNWNCPPHPCRRSFTPSRIWSRLLDLPFPLFFSFQCPPSDIETLWGDPLFWPFVMLLMIFSVLGSLLSHLIAQLYPRFFLSLFDFCGLSYPLVVPPNQSMVNSCHLCLGFLFLLFYAFPPFFPMSLETGLKVPLFSSLPCELPPFCKSARFDGGGFFLPVFSETHVSFRILKPFYSLNLRPSFVFLSSS